MKTNKQQTGNAIQRKGEVHFGASIYSTAYYIRPKPGKSFKQKALLILGILFFFGNNYVQAQFVNAYSSFPINSLLTVEKTIRGLNPDSSFYILSNGENTSTTTHQLYITELSKVTQSGGIIWTKTYGISPTTGGISTKLQGICITVDSSNMAPPSRAPNPGIGPTGHIAIGGYVQFDGFTDNDFVLVLDTSGAVLWFQYWNPFGGSNAYASEGVTDLIFNNESGANQGSITAVSVDENTTYGNDNLYVTLINNSGIIASQQLTDAGADYFQTYGSPIDTTLKPRIVESKSNGSYYVVGSRGFYSSGLLYNDIGFWEVPYGLTISASLYEYYDGSGYGYDIYASGAIEDEGSFSPSGHPHVYISGFYMNNGFPNPLLIEVEVTSSPPPVFTALQIPSPFSIAGYGYLYLTDIALLPVLTISSYYQLMITASYYDGSSTKNMQMYSAPMNFSATPTSTYNVLSGSAVPQNEFGGLCSTKRSYIYIAAGKYVSQNKIDFCRTDNNIYFSCYNGSTTSTNNPSYTYNSTTPGTPWTETSYQDTITIGVQPFQVGNHICPTPPEQDKPEHGSQNIFGATGANDASPVDIYPNPVSTTAWIDINGQTATTATIRLFDLSGREIISKYVGVVVGENHIPVDVEALSPGAYIMQVMNPDKTINASVNLVKY